MMKKVTVLSKSRLQRSFLKDHAAATLEYVMLILIVLGSFIVFQKYIFRGIGGKWQSVGESYGFRQQYDPKKTIECMFDSKYFQTWFDKNCAGAFNCAKDKVDCIKASIASCRPPCDDGSGGACVPTGECIPTGEVLCGQLNAGVDSCGSSCTIPGPECPAVCPDGSCNGSEDCSTCPEDCPCPPPPDGCVPTTSCAAEGKTCGTLFDGCATVTCGPACGGGCVSDGSCSAAEPVCGQTTFGTDNCGTACSKTGAPCPCVSDGSCSAAEPACGQTTTGTDNCGTSCQKIGPACPCVPGCVAPCDSFCIDDCGTVIQGPRSGCHPPCESDCVDDCGNIIYSGESCSDE